MSFDGITLKRIVAEISELLPAKVNKISQSNNQNLFLNIYSHKNYNLLIDTNSVNYRTNITTKSFKNMPEPSNFCMALRKHLNSSKLTKIYTKGFERILYLEFETYNEMNDLITKTLICELMGKYSNIVLVNENFKIIDALKKFDISESKRDIMFAREYILPPENTKDFFDFTQSTFVEFLLNNEEKKLTTILPQNITGISKLFIEKSLFDLKISDFCTKQNLELIYDHIINILNSSKLVSFKNNYCLEFAKSDFLESNLFLDDYYFQKQTNDDFKNFKNNILKVLNNIFDKITKKISNINKKILETNKMDEYKIYGELILSNIHSLNNFNDTIEVFNYYENKNQIIPIKKSQSLVQNSNEYFKKYNKLKNTLKSVTVQKEEAEKEINYIQTLLYQIDECTNINDLEEIYEEINNEFLFINHKNKKQKTKKVDMESIKNFIKLKIDDFDVFIGKNNKQNDYLTKTLSKSNDLWFHTKDIPSSHIILKCDGNIPKQSTIEKIAKLTAYHSKARFSSHVPVDYTFIKFVKKPNNSPLGFVIYTNQKTVFVNPSSII